MSNQQAMTDITYIDASHALQRAYSPVRCSYGTSVFDRRVSSGCNPHDMMVQDSYNRQFFDRTLRKLGQQLCRLRWADEAVDVNYILNEIMPSDMNRNFALQCLQTWSERNLGVGAYSVGAWSKRISTPTGQLYRRSVKIKTALQNQMNECYAISDDYLTSNGLIKDAS